jgi:ech hydrogenase subunit D
MTVGAQIIKPIEVSRLIGQVEELKNAGYRLSAISCVKVDDLYEINYSFDKDYELETLRITVSGDTDVPSITGMYWGAFVYENEMHDLFGIPVRGMNIDFKGTFIRTAIKYPFSIAAPKGGKP